MTPGTAWAALARLLCWGFLQLPTQGFAAYAPVDPADVQALLARMSLREKLEHTGITVFAESDMTELRVNPLDVPKLVPFFNAENWFDLKDHEHLGLRGMRTRDGPRGVTCLLGGMLPFGSPCPRDGSTPAFPHANLRAATWDRDLEEEFGRAVGEIAKVLDVHAALLPCINILPWLNAGRSQEAYGEDPLLNGKMGAATVRGVQSKGVMATPKHFLANNIENTRWMVSAEMSDKTLHEVYLKKWAILVAESSPEFIMTSYNRVQGNWSNIDPKFIKLLREKLGFQGSVMTDWLAIMTFSPGMIPGSPFKGRSDFFGDLNSALVAGVDMEMPFNSRHIQAVRQLAACAADDKVTCTTANMLDRAVGHLLRSKLRYGLVGTKRPPRETARYDNAKYNELALRIAERGIVLLENKGGFLPKRPADVRSVVVMGTPLFLELGDRGSSAQKPSGEVVNVLHGLFEQYGYSKVRHLSRDQAMSEEVQKADMVVLDVGLNFSFEGEYVPPSTGGDRQYLTLHPEDMTLIRQASSVNSNVVVAMTSGANILVEDFVDSVSAILWLGYPGPLGGRALAKILSGVVNPAGRMTSATPKKPGDWVPAGITLVPWRGSEIKYPYAHGFKHMWQAKITPRYPIGWGLSYTQFSFGAPSLTSTTSDTSLETTVRVKVRNTGTLAGIETVQVYVTCSSCKRERLAVLLVGFGRVQLDAGEEKEVSVSVSAKEFAVYDENVSLWLLESAEYILLVGPCGDAQRLTGVSYTVLLDFSFDYAGASTKPHVPGIGVRDCSTSTCTVDEAFTSEEAAKALQARVFGSICLLLCLGTPVAWICCCRHCCRRCCKKKSKKAKKS